MNTLSRLAASLIVVVPLAAAASGCAAAEDDPGDEPAIAESSTDALTDDQVSQSYNCLSNAAYTIAGTAAVVSCGLGAAPSGGLTTLCFIAGAGGVAGGTLAYCGARCPGAQSFCPGYRSQSVAFRETSRLVSRCVGTARYSHWELTDPNLIRTYGRSRAEFRSGDCACPRGQICATP